MSEIVYKEILANPDGEHNNYGSWCAASPDISGTKFVLGDQYDAALALIETMGEALEVALKGLIAADKTELILLSMEIYDVRKALEAHKAFKEGAK